MSEIKFEMGPIRPPSESRSLIIRLTRGCHWNKCHFCGLYKNMKFSIRPVEDVLQDIVNAAEYYKGYPFKSCFLQDGDAFILKTENLIKIIDVLKQNFPALEYITCYSRANSITRKSIIEMKEIKDAGLNHLYCGMESGSDVVLKKINKGITAKDIIESGKLAKEAGVILSEFILLGIGGKELWIDHAEKTAQVLNIINPEFIRVHATGIKEETELGNAVKNGGVLLQSEEEIIIEQKLLIQNLNDINSLYLNEHAINLLMEVNGRLPHDKQRMLDIIDQYLMLKEKDKLNFAIGRRMGNYFYLNDLSNENTRNIVEQNIVKIKENIPDANFNEICNYYRSQII